MKAEVRIKKLVRRGLAAAFIVSSFILLPSAFSSGDTPVKNAKISGTSAVTGGTLSISSGVAVTFLAGSTLDVSLGTLTLADNQVPWAKVNKSGSSFLNLGDTPSSYVSQALKVVRVNSGATALEFGVAPAGDFLGLTDTPSSYTGQGLKSLRVNAGATGIEFFAAAAGDFLGLTDTPLSYSGQAGKVATVNMAETGLIFATASGGASAFLGLSDTPSAYTGAGGNFVKVNSGATGVEFVAPGSAPYARVYNSASISLTTAILTTLTFNSERDDTEAIHDTSTNTSRLTCQTAGTYLISGNVRFATNTSGRRMVQIQLNGTTVIGFQSVPPTDAQTNILATTLYKLAAGDYVELIAYQSSGGALTVDAVANYSPEFGMVKVGDSTSGGGSAWTQKINESGASLTNWTIASGTWSSNATEILQTATGNADRRLYYTTPLVSSAWTLSADVYVTSGSAGAAVTFGIFDGATTSGYAVATLRASTAGGGLRVTIDSENAAIRVSSANTVASFDAYQTLKIYSAGDTMSVWIGTTLVAVGSAEPNGFGNNRYFAINAHDASIKVKNVKLWRPTLPID